MSHAKELDQESHKEAGRILQKGKSRGEVRRRLCPAGSEERLEGLGPHKAPGGFSQDAFKDAPQESEEKMKMPRKMPMKKKMPMHTPQMDKMMGKDKPKKIRKKGRK